MKRLFLASVLFVLAAGVARPGVVIEMEASDSSSEGAVATDVIYADGKMLRMDPHEGRGGGKSSMIFRDDTMWFVDHDKKRCQTIDKQGVEQLSAQIGGVMKEMEAQLAELPPEQRKMMEKMMKGRMPGGMGQEAPPRRIEKGATEQVGEYSCVVHTLYVGDEKVWEVCSADQSAVSTFAEAMEAFRAMSDFTKQLREMAMQGPLSGMMQTPFSDMEAIGGVPVRVRSFSRGQLQSESTLKSVLRKDIDETFFAPPEGYKVKSLADEIKKGR